MDSDCENLVYFGPEYYGSRKLSKNIDKKIF